MRTRRGARTGCDWAGGGRCRATAKDTTNRAQRRESLLASQPSSRIPHARSDARPGTIRPGSMGRPSASERDAAMCRCDRPCATTARGQQKKNTEHRPPQVHPYAPHPEHEAGRFHPSTPYPGLCALYSVVLVSAGHEGSLWRLFLLPARPQEVGNWKLLDRRGGRVSGIWFVCVVYRSCCCPPPHRLALPATLSSLAPLGSLFTHVPMR
jgi:hypothetical protein